MNKAEEAIRLFSGNFNCAQSVLSAFAQELGLEREPALKIATSFGGGIAHLDELCGAMTGALMVIGLKHGMVKDEDLEAKEKTYALSQEFAARFKSRNGSLRCTELIGYNLGLPEDYEKAREADVFNARCKKFVKDSVEILEELLGPNK